MSSYLSNRRARGAVARTAVRTMPSLHVIAGVYFLSLGVLALALALNRL
jgi:hypothetical protein